MVAPSYTHSRGLSAHTMSSSRSRTRSTSHRPHAATSLPDRSEVRQPKSPSVRADTGWFEEVFRCYICLQNLTKPTLCPKCSKLCCEPCIKKWLREQKEECPHCRANIDQTHLVPCRFLDDIQELKNITSNEPDKMDLCPDHKTRMTYYCHTCQIPICSDCGMFGLKHRDHKFEHLGTIYDQRVEGLKSYLVALRKRMAKFAKKIKEVDRKVQNCNLAKIESDRELVGLVNRYRTNLELQLREKHNILFSQRGTLVKQADFLQATINKLDSVLTSQSQVEVLQSDEKVIQILKQVEQVILHNPGDDISVDMTFEKDFLPSYDLYRFNIPRFSQLLEMGAFESNLVSQGGLVWRLRASIEGKTEKCSGHLALFIQLVQGDPQPSRYYIRVEIKHPTRPDSVIREFPFDMKAGDARGFRQFCRVQTLIAKGFVDPNGGYPQLICGIRPLSYRQRSRDQRRYIQELEEQLAQYKATPATILTETPDTDTDDAYGEELVGPSDAMLVVSPVPDQHPPVSLLRDDSSQLQSSASSHLVRPVSPFDCDFHQAPQPSIPPPLRPAKVALSRGEMHRRRASRHNGSPHSENSSDSEYDEDMDQCSTIPSFTSTDELRQLIHQEFDTWSGNLSALAPCPAPRSRIHALSSPSQSDSVSSGLSSSCPTPGQPPLSSPLMVDPEPTRSRHRSHSAATYYTFNSPSRSSFSVYAAPSSPSSSEA